MGFGLSIYGMALGFVCAAVSSLAGQISILAALALYSATGVTFVVLGALLVAWRDTQNTSRINQQPAHLQTTFAD